MQFDAVLEKLLARHALRKTPLRLNLLAALKKRRVPARQGELLVQLQKKMPTVDRVSVYRNLNQLKNAGVIHEVDTNRYVLCEHECEVHAHILLFCERCRRHVEPHDHRQIESLFAALAPFRFFSLKAPVFLQGVCRECESPKSPKTL